MSKIKERIYVKESLGKVDIERSTEDVYELIVNSILEARKRNIEANSIVINKNMVEVPEIFGESPHMICGLNVHFNSRELPDGYSFAVCHDPHLNKDRLAEFEAIGMEPDELRKAADMYKKVKSVFMEK